MASSKKLKPFSITSRIVVLSAIVVQAENLEQALVKSREYKVQDFVEVIADHHDSSIMISSVTLDGSWNVEQNES
jgi:hypothetical protein